MALSRWLLHAGLMALAAALLTGCPFETIVIGDKDGFGWGGHGNAEEPTPQYRLLNEPGPMGEPYRSSNLACCDVHPCTSGCLRPFNRDGKGILARLDYLPDVNQRCIYSCPAPACGSAARRFVNWHNFSDEGNGPGFHDWVSDDWDLRVEERHDGFVTGAADATRYSCEDVQCAGASFTDLTLSLSMRQSYPGLAPGDLPFALDAAAVGFPHAPFDNPASIDETPPQPDAWCSGEPPYADVLRPREDPSRATFVFDFAVPQKVVRTVDGKWKWTDNFDAGGAELFLHIVHADHEIGSVTVELRAHGGEPAAVPLAAHDMPNRDGLVERCTIPLSRFFTFDELARFRPERAQYHIQLDVNLVHKNPHAIDPYIAFDYAELTVTPPPDFVIAGPGRRYRSIQAAIRDAENGAVIEVEPGVYHENIHFLGKDIVVRSMNPQDDGCVAKTIIDGNRAGPVVTFAGNEAPTAALSGFTIRNGLAENGGGIHGNGFEGIISRCVITQNEASQSGGGVANVVGVMHRCIIRGNRAVWGGGAAAEGHRADIRRCRIHDNAAAHAGGGIFVRQGGIVSIENTIENNETSREGGGVYLERASGTLRHTMLRENTALHAGGGAALKASPQVHIEAAYFGGNVVSNGAGGGLAVRGEAASAGAGPTIVNSVFWQNRAACVLESDLASAGFGGGIANQDHSALALINCTIAANAAQVRFEDATPYGGGLANLGAAAWTSMTNVLIWGNTPDGVYEGSSAPEMPLVRHSNIQASTALSGRTGAYCELFEGRCGPGNFNPAVEPLFVNPGEGRLALMVTSPLIDTGTAEGAPYNDHVRTPRPQGPYPDIGAYEIVQKNAPPVNDPLD